MAAATQSKLQSTHHTNILCSAGERERRIRHMECSEWLGQRKGQRKKERCRKNEGSEDSESCNMKQTHCDAPTAQAFDAQE